MAIKETLANWANKIDIWNDWIKDTWELLDIKKRLTEDMLILWEKLQKWDITDEEYSRHSLRFREILEENFKTTKEVFEKYEIRRKEILEETKTKINRLTNSEIEEILDSKDIFTSIDNIYTKNSSWFEHKLLDDFYWDKKYYDKLKRKIFDSVGQNACMDKNSPFTKFFEKLKKQEYKNNSQIELEIYLRNKKIPEKYIGDLVLLLKNKDDKCNFDIIYEVENFSKQNNLKLETEDIKKIVLKQYNINIEKERWKLISIIEKNKLNEEKIDKLIDKKDELKEYLKKNNVSDEDINYILLNVEKLKNKAKELNRIELMENKDIKKIINAKRSWKSNSDIMKDLEKNNKDLKKYNEKEEKKEDKNNSFNSSANLSENKRIIELSKKYNVDFDYLRKCETITIPSWTKNFWEFNELIYAIVDEEWSKNIQTPSWIKYNLHTSWNQKWIYGLKYWGTIVEWIEKKEVRWVMSFIRFGRKMWIDFLLNESSRLLRKINENSNGEWLEIKDWLSEKEKNLILKKLWPVLIPWYEHQTESSESIKQFTNPVLLNTRIQEARNKDDSNPQLQSIDWKVDNVQELAKILYPKDKEIDCLKIIENIV